MIEHIDRSFSFARRLGLGIEQIEQIILVTGCDRATSWTNVAFLGNHDDARVSIGVRIFDPDGPNTSINFQFPPGNVQGAVLNHGPQGTVRRRVVCKVNGFEMTLAYLCPLGSTRQSMHFCPGISCRSYSQNIAKTPQSSSG